MRFFIPFDHVSCCLCVCLLVGFVVSTLCCCLLLSHMTLLLNSIFGFFDCSLFLLLCLCFNDCSTDHCALVRTHTYYAHRNRRDRSTVLAVAYRHRAVPTVRPTACAFPRHNGRLVNDSSSTIPRTHLIEGVLHLAIGTPINLGDFNTTQLSTAQACNP